MSLDFKELDIPGLMVIEAKKIKDERGFFMEKYKESLFKEIGLPLFVQDNLSFSKENVVRGLHFQKDPYGQGKLVTVVSGKVWDVAVDIRPSSAYFGQWRGVELSAENNLSFYIPPGFAHGFSVLSKEAHFFYKCTQEYSPLHEMGINFNDADLGVDWKVIEPIVSVKDLRLPTLKDIKDQL